MPPIPWLPGVQHRDVAQARAAEATLRLMGELTTSNELLALLKEKRCASRRKAGRLLIASIITSILAILVFGFLFGIVVVPPAIQLGAQPYVGEALSRMAQKWQEVQPASTLMNRMQQAALQQEAHLDVGVKVAAIKTRPQPVPASAPVATPAEDLQQMLFVAAVLVAMIATVVYLESALIFTADAGTAACNDTEHKIQHASASTDDATEPASRSTQVEAERKRGGATTDCAVPVQQDDAKVPPTLVCGDTNLVSGQQLGGPQFTGQEHSASADDGGLRKPCQEPGREYAAVAAATSMLLSGFKASSRSVLLAACAGDESMLRAAQGELHTAVAQLLDLDLAPHAYTASGGACKVLAYSAAATPVSGRSIPSFGVEGLSHDPPSTDGTSWPSISSRVVSSAPSPAAVLTSCSGAAAVDGTDVWADGPVPLPGDIDSYLAGRRRAIVSSSAHALAGLQGTLAYAGLMVNATCSQVAMLRTEQLEAVAARDTAQEAVDLWRVRALAAEARLAATETEAVVVDGVAAVEVVEGLHLDGDSDRGEDVWRPDGKAARGPSVAVPGTPVHSIRGIGASGSGSDHGLAAARASQTLTKSDEQVKQTISNVCTPATARCPVFSGRGAAVTPRQLW